MPNRVRHLRTTQIALDNNASAGLLLEGEIYLVANTTPKKLVMAISTTEYQEYQLVDSHLARTDTAGNWQAPQRHAFFALTSDTTITINLAEGNDYSLALDHNAILANPPDIIAHLGLKGSIIGNNVSASRTLSYDSQWYPIGNLTPTLPANAGDRWRIDFHVTAVNRIEFSLSTVA